MRHRRPRDSFVDEHGDDENVRQISNGTKTIENGVISEVKETIDNEAVNWNGQVHVPSHTLINDSSNL